MRTTQAAWERWRNITRTQQVRDPFSRPSPAFSLPALLYISLRCVSRPQGSAAASRGAEVLAHKCCLEFLSVLMLWCGDHLIRTILFNSNFPGTAARLSKRKE